jgi:Mce-associated membrane protein
MTEPEQPEEPRERLWLVAGALVGVIVAGVLIGVFVLTGDNDPGVPASRVPRPSTPAGPATADAGRISAARDESLRAAEAAAVVLNTLDHRDVRLGLERWESVATNPLLDELSAKRAETLAAVQKAKTTSTAKVLAAAVSRVAADNLGTEVLVAVEVTVVDANGDSAVSQIRQKLGMVQTGMGWKVSALTRVEPLG